VVFKFCPGSPLNLRLFGELGYLFGGQLSLVCGSSYSTVLVSRPEQLLAVSESETGEVGSGPPLQPVTANARNRCDPELHSMPIENSLEGISKDFTTHEILKS
jgi:hypothetical protein